MSEKLISGKKLKTFGYSVFTKIGVPKRIYKIVVDGLVEASLRGIDSHGVRLIPHYVKAAMLGRIYKNPKFSFTKTGFSTGVFDADHGYGIAAGTEAMKQAMKLARKTGVGGVAVKNSSHFGAAATYSLLAAKNDMIGLSFTNVDSLVLPHGGKKPFLGTNPICFAAPCMGEEPFCLDMATTPISWNKLLSYRRDSKKLEKGWAADKDGNCVEDPDLAAGLLPISTYKGYGLSLMVEIFSSLLTGMPFGPHINPMYPLNSKKRYLGHFFMAIDIARFERIQSFKRRLKNLMNELRSQPTVSGIDKVRVSGDPEKESYEVRRTMGIPVSKHDFSALRAMAIEVGLKQQYINLL